MQPRKLLLFGAVGTLAETSEWQREAFNLAFTEAGVNWHWDRQTYRSLLRIPGGQNRLSLYASSVGETVDAAHVHTLKTRLYNDMLASRPLSARPGVVAVLDWAAQNAVTVGFASTTYPENIDALFHALRDEIPRGQFAYVGNRHRVAKTKPAPDIYLDALAQTGFTPADCLAVEDTTESLESAYNAGIPVLAFPGENSSDHDFKNAVRTVDTLSPELISELIYGTPQV